MSRSALSSMSRCAVLEHFAQSPLAQSLINSDLVARELPFSCPAAVAGPDEQGAYGHRIYRPDLPNSLGRNLVVADWKVTGGKRTTPCSRSATDPARGLPPCRVSPLP